MLEGRHVLAVFFAIVVLSAVFFTLGYVLGRMQGEARSAGVAAVGRRPAQPPGSKAPSGEAPASGQGAGSPSDLSFYEAVEKKGVNAELTPKPAAPVETKLPTKPPETPVGTAAHPPGITLQVAALLRREDAESVAEVLKHKKYPVIVVPPSADQFYRVQVGPFANEQMAQRMRKRLEDDGFKVITKR